MSGSLSESESLEESEEDSSEDSSAARGLWYIQQTRTQISLVYVGWEDGIEVTGGRKSVMEGEYTF